VVACFGAVVVVAVVVLVVVLVGGDGGGSDEGGRGPGPVAPVTARPLGAGVVQLTLPGALPPLGRYALATVGGKVFGVTGEVLTGKPGRNDAFLYDPTAATLRKVGAPPFSPAADGLAAAAARRSVVVVGTLCELSLPDGADEPLCSPGTLGAAVFDVDALRWRSIAPPPGGRRADGTGAAVLALPVARDEAIFAVGKGLVAFDPETDEWRKLPLPSDAADGMASYCVAGTHLVASWFDPPLTMDGGMAPDPATPRSLVLAAFDTATDGPWSSVPRNPWDDPSNGTHTRLGCGGDHVVVRGLRFSGWARYDLAARRWAAIPAAPAAESVRGDGTTPVPMILDGQLWTGRELAFWPSVSLAVDGWALTPATDAWRRIDRGPGLFVVPDRVTTHDGVVYYLVGDLDGGLLFSWTPVPYDGRAPEPAVTAPKPPIPQPPEISSPTGR
jgi:hypothetical protein